MTTTMTDTQQTNRQSENGASTKLGDDYPLRFAPRHYRTWAPATVAGSALGGMAYLADFSIGAGIGIAHGTASAVGGILIAAALIFLSSAPLAIYAAKFNLDLDLITRGSGFGYYGSIITNVIFATFTFIFFATEGAIMAQGLKLGLGVPLWLGYLISTVIIIPVVVFGMKLLQKVQTATNPLWLVMMVLPLGYLVIRHPESVENFLSYQGNSGGTNLAGMMASAGVCLALAAQIAENIDYIRFMPPKTKDNAVAWWVSVLMSGPGWVIFGAAKQIIGVFLAVYVLSVLGGSATEAVEPVHQFMNVYREMMPTGLAVTLAVLLVVMSQIKINATNAYSGSLAWTNAYTRVVKSYPGRIVFVFVNLGISLALMEFNMFSMLNAVLGFYSNLAIAWIFTVAADIAINKWLLKISPIYPEYRRGMIHDFNSVGIVSLVASALISVAMYFGVFGEALAPYSALAAAAIAVVLTPVMAIVTRGRYYRRRFHDGIDAPFFDEYGNPSDESFVCVVTGEQVERPDAILSAQRGEKGQAQYISSLALTMDKEGAHVMPAQATRVSE
ncbi:purine-cytosine permease family protein [Corynebacterium lactis]|uniref:Allantoin permease n=1 Tax=Corynebacterium lactis RW2-5 TaxID=1408189 RepID=A0A0K2GYB5_9CORY|nr:allantoin permease [Corynebacterium lactis RW2-5]